MSDPGGRRVVLHAVGDIGFGGRLRSEAAFGSGSDPFDEAAHLLDGADLLFGNLETPLVEDGREPSVSEIRTGFAGAPGQAEWLKRHGFDIVSVANNHIMDYGIDGLRSTLGALRAAGISAVGAGESLAEATRSRVAEAGGRRIAFLAYASEGPHTAGPERPGAAPLREALVLDGIRGALREADSVVVSLHFGLVYSDYPRLEDQGLARRLCDAGATIVLGHHPHVLQGVERRGRSLVAYSLGEILFDPASGHVVNRTADQVRRESMVLRVELDEGGAGAWECRPTLRDDASLHPVPPGDEDRARIIDRITRISAPLVSGRLDGAEVQEQNALRTAGHEWDVFVHHLRKGHVGILFKWILRLRPRHILLALTALRARLRSS